MYEFLFFCVEFPIEFRFWWFILTNFFVGGIGHAPVYSLKQTDITLHGLRKIRLKEVHAIAIVHEDTGKLVGCLSESDLRELTPDTYIFLFPGDSFYFLRVRQMIWENTYHCFFLFFLSFFLLTLKVANFVRLPPRLPPSFSTQK